MIVRTSTMKACFLCAECIYLIAKKQKKTQNASILVLFFPFFSKYVTKRTEVSIFFHKFVPEKS